MIFEEDENGSIPNGDVIVIHPGRLTAGTYKSSI